MDFKKRFKSLVFYRGWKAPITIDANRGALLNFIFSEGDERFKGFYSLLKQATSSPSNLGGETLPHPDETSIGGHGLIVSVIDPDWEDTFKRAATAVRDGNDPSYYLVRDEEMAKEMGEGLRCKKCGSTLLADDEEICGGCKT